MLFSNRIKGSQYSYVFFLGVIKKKYVLSVDQRRVGCRAATCASYDFQPKESRDMRGM